MTVAHIVSISPEATCAKTHNVINVQNVIPTHNVIKKSLRNVRPTLNVIKNCEM